MRKKFIQLTSGWIPVSMLLLFTFALITAQARDELPAAVEATPGPATFIILKAVISK